MFVLVLSSLQEGIMREDIGWGTILFWVGDILWFLLNGISILLGNTDPNTYLEFFGAIALAVLYLIYLLFLKKD